MLSLLSLPIRGKRDVLLARQRARQIAKMFQFDALEQACIEHTLHITAQPQVEEGSPAPVGLLRLEKALPAAGMELAPADMAWLLEQLNRQRSFNLFEEVERQNQETLMLLHALHTTRNQNASSNDTQVSPAAA
jgi:hypothetical protein